MPAAVPSAQQIDFFREHGYLKLSNVLTEDEIAGMVRNDSNASSDLKGRIFSRIEKGMMYKDAHFRKVALSSDIPRICAELLNLDQSESLRILRDVYLAKPVDSDEFCDWHVDDRGFWPARYEDSVGINVWISIDEMPIEYEGSMAVLPGSHTQDDLRYEGYKSIGQDRSVENDMESMEQFITLFSSTVGTCNLHKNNPALHSRMEENKMLFDLKRGDVIFATRLLFHRTMPVTDEGREYYRRNGMSTLDRYSLRYVPGVTRLPPTFHILEWSVLSDPENTGRSLDDVAKGDSCWYPKVWPTVEDGASEKLEAIGLHEMPQAKQKVTELLAQAKQSAIKKRDLIK